MSKLTWLAWVNVFGPDYVEKYGKNFFLGLPGCEKRVLADGSVLHRITPTLVVANSSEAREARQQVKEYCEKHEMVVECYAPYKNVPPRPVDKKGAD